MSIVTPPTRIRSADTALRARAHKVVPGGMYGHLSVELLPQGYPQYYSSGLGSRLVDVDGNDYLDLMCGFGPMVSGYRNPVVEAAAAAQQAEGDVLGGPSARLVELAELLVDTVTHADWAQFAKNGTDATSMAVMVARAATGRKKLLKGVTAYHGANAWFNPNPAGTTPEDRANIIEFTFNDLASLEAAAAEGGNDVAGIILSPFGHDLPGTLDQQLVDPAFAHGVRALADRLDAVLIMDEVRTGFRLNLAGSWTDLGIEPDITAFSKAIANGFALSAVVGRESLRDAAASIYTTGSFWYGAVAMAAAIANLTELRSFDSTGQMERIGMLLRDGLQSQATSHGLEIVQTGPASMPYMRFAADTSLQRAVAFSDAAVRRGVLLHPAHNWFLSTAHTEADIAAILDRTDEAFAEISSLEF